MSKTMTIADLVPEEEAVISGFSADGAHLKRFREMGLMRGTELKMIRKVNSGNSEE